MEGRTLTITVQADWKGALRAASKMAQAPVYKGETLNFENPELFLGRLTALRWTLVRLLMGAEEVPVRELARRAGRDVKRVHEDVLVLAELGLVERSKSGGVICPFVDIHVD
ncbi:hypothetical protein B1A_21111, partial [mine drainage metagenome]